MYWATRWNCPVFWEWGRILGRHEGDVTNTGAAASVLLSTRALCVTGAERFILRDKCLTCRGRKRKLLPGKRADKATAEALFGALDLDALPLKTMATPVAMRVRRRHRS